MMQTTMKHNIVTMNTIVLVMVLVATASCNGQGAPEAEATNFVTKNVSLPIGEIVPELGNSIMIIYQAANGDYWFGSDVDGVYAYDGKHHTLQHQRRIV